MGCGTCSAGGHATQLGCNQSIQRTPAHRQMQPTITLRICRPRRKDERGRRGRASTDPSLGSKEIAPTELLILVSARESNHRLCLNIAPGSNLADRRVLYCPSWKLKECVRVSHGDCTLPHKKH